MPTVTVIEPREVPLGGLRAMNVRRTLPSRGRTMVGAWCFLDHYGPDDVAETGGMVVSAHPHTGLQTVSWLFSGEIEHRDSAGHRAIVRPGEVNLMTAGRGISHTEVSTRGTTSLHGAQLWVALPDASRRWSRGSSTTRRRRCTVRAGRHGSSSAPRSARPPRSRRTPRFSVPRSRSTEGTTLEIPVDPSYEHGVLVDTGALMLGGTSVKPSQLAFVPVGADRLVLHASDETRLLLLGGTPLGERIVMWWNFVGRDHDEIAEYRRQWQALLGGEEPGAVLAAGRRPLPRDTGAGAAPRGAAHAARVRRGPGLSPRGN